MVLCFTKKLTLVKHKTASVAIGLAWQLGTAQQPTVTMLSIIKQQTITEQNIEATIAEQNIGGNYRIAYRTTATAALSFPDWLFRGNRLWSKPRNRWWGCCGKTCNSCMETIVEQTIAEWNYCIENYYVGNYCRAIATKYHRALIWLIWLIIMWQLVTGQNLRIESNIFRWCCGNTWTVPC